MRLSDIGMLAVDSGRTRAYLHALTKNNLLPAQVIFLNSASATAKKFPEVPYFDNATPALETIKRLGISCEVVDTEDINSAPVAAAVRSSPTRILIFSGPGGAIVRQELLDSGKRFLHIHPGLVPEFRGSTTIYYSLLMTGECGASAIFLDKEIDTGPLIAQVAFPPPADRRLIDYGYDPFIRSELLARVLAEYAEKGRLELQQQPTGGETYYIMHPVLRHITILSHVDGQII